MDNLLVGPLLLMPAHSVQQFDCGSTSLNTYLAKNALQNQTNQRARTYIVTNDVVTNYIIGYFTLAYGSAATALLDTQKNYAPLMLLARLAVDKSGHEKGLGKALLKHALLKSLKAAEVAGLLAVVVHAQDESTRTFYQKFGFIQTPFHGFHLFLLIKDIKNNFKN